jgi:hypothetical protein
VLALTFVSRTSQLCVYRTIPLDNGSATTCHAIEKLIVTQVQKEFAAVYGTQRFNIVSSRARHWFLS